MLLSINFGSYSIWFQHLLKQRSQTKQLDKLNLNICFEEPLKKDWTLSSGDLWFEFETQFSRIMTQTSNLEYVSLIFAISRNDQGKSTTQKFHSTKHHPQASATSLSWKYSQQTFSRMFTWKSHTKHLRS